MRKQSWIPLPEVTEATEGQIAVGHTGLPVGLDQERLEVNVGALRRGVINFGGYSAMTLAAYAGDADQYGYSASSTDGSGTGTAAFGVTIQKAESANNNVLSDVEMNRRNVRNGSLGVQWNSTVLNQQLEIHEQYEPAARARQLDRVIRAQSIKGVTAHNIPEYLKAKDKFFRHADIGFDLYFLTVLTANMMEGDAQDAAGFVTTRLVLGLGLLPAINSFRGNIPWRENIHDPVFWSARPLRATAAAGVLATSKLVRAVE